MKIRIKVSTLLVFFLFVSCAKFFGLTLIKALCTLCFFLFIVVLDILNNVVDFNVLDLFELFKFLFFVIFFWVNVW